MNPLRMAILGPQFSGSESIVCLSALSRRVSHRTEHFDNGDNFVEASIGFADYQLVLRAGVTPLFYAVDSTRYLLEWADVAALALCPAEEILALNEPYIATVRDYFSEVRNLPILIVSNDVWGGKFHGRIVSHSGLPYEFPPSWALATTRIGPLYPQISGLEGACLDGLEDILCFSERGAREG